MTNSGETIAYLKSVNPRMLLWPVEDMEPLREAQKDFYSCVEECLGPVEKFSEGEENRMLACVVVPLICMSEPHEYARVILSKFEKLFSVVYPWDLKEEILNALITRLEREGFKYIPFEVFAERKTYNWRNLDNSIKHGIVPPAGAEQFVNEDIFDGLFGY